MKKTILTFLVSLILTFAVDAQTGASAEQKNALDEIGRLNGQTITLFKQKDYDGALKAALEVWNIAEKNNLSKDLRVLPALINLGEVYLAKGKEADAIAVFQKIIDAYQANSGDQRRPVVKMFERIAAAYFFKRDYNKSEEFFLKALSLREVLNGAESREVARINNGLGDLYRKREQYEKADEFYLKAIRMNDKILGIEAKEKRQDVDDYECFIYHKALQEDKLTDVSRRLKEFNDSRKTAKPETVNSGVVNGRAINLVRPPFPAQMRGASGFALVRVTIDEAGNVTDAKTTCGIIGFLEAAEKAAQMSKFTPTILAGRAVKVTGVIVYNFVR